ncbi:hypothetical protein E2562_019960 [Oryza meyeriana var. granulata]|uniref:Uncharacterized protein n=1 Tax=Oryza meyeriana var. granulata TaxID=110450 RepID=A0A6G1CGZ8_9ORYZ|nr:hypothetical protein E2562_019960 [Oryza meyeriana var. granulata]
MSSSMSDVNRRRPAPVEGVKGLSSRGLSRATGDVSPPQQPDRPPTAGTSPAVAVEGPMLLLRLLLDERRQMLTRYQTK